MKEPANNHIRDFGWLNFSCLQRDFQTIDRIVSSCIRVNFRPLKYKIYSKEVKKSPGLLMPHHHVPVGLLFHHIPVVIPVPVPVVPVPVPVPVPIHVVIGVIPIVLLLLPAPSSHSSSTLRAVARSGGEGVWWVCCCGAVSAFSLPVFVAPASPSSAPPIPCEQALTAAVGDAVLLSLLFAVPVPICRRSAFGVRVVSCRVPCPVVMVQCPGALSCRCAYPCPRPHPHCPTPSSPHEQGLVAVGVGGSSSPP
jgi:hypothetical protein